MRFQVSAECCDSFARTDIRGIPDSRSAERKPRAPNEMLLRVTDGRFSAEADRRVLHGVCHWTRLAKYGGYRYRRVLHGVCHWTRLALANMGVTGIYSFVFDIFISFWCSFMTNLLELYNSVMCCFCWYLEGQYSSFSFRIVWCWCQTLLWLQVHYSCECVTTAAESVAVTGRCEGECRLLSMFLVIFALIIFVTFTTSMPALAATLRYVLCRDVKR